MYNGFLKRFPVKFKSIFWIQAEDQTNTRFTYHLHIIAGRKRMDRQKTVVKPVMLLPINRDHGPMDKIIAESDFQEHGQSDGT
jgi:hypothetical protein